MKKNALKTEPLALRGDSAKMDIRMRRSYVISVVLAATACGSSPEAPHSDSPIPVSGANSGSTVARTVDASSASGNTADLGTSDSGLRYSGQSGGEVDAYSPGETTGMEDTGLPNDRMDAQSTIAPSDSGSAAGHDGAGAEGGSTGGTFSVPFDWNGIIATGQSLSVGRRGLPVITTTQPFHNLKLYDPSGTYALDSTGNLSVVPLVEPIRAICATAATAYPCNINGETPQTMLSIELTTLAKASGASDYVTVHSVTGQGSQPLSVIDKGGKGNAYAAGLSEARSFEKLSKSAGKTFGYVAVVFTHGEADNASSSTYETGLFQLYRDYNTDIPTITAQTRTVPIIASQQVSYPPVGNGLTNAPMTGTALALWRASVDHPGQIICSGPKYQYKYYVTGGTDTDPHVYSAGYRRLGEKYAEIIASVVNHGASFTPLEPMAASLAGASLTVNFSVPNPPLAWEPSLTVATTVAAWKNGRGFEVVDSAGPVTITSAAIAGSSVVLTLASAPTGSAVRVRYAMYNGCTTNCGDHLLGQLRDSDPFVGADVQTIACTVTQGSADIVCGSGTSLNSREVHDIVESQSLPADTVILSTDKATKATLSSAWTGSSGAANLTFAYDERNYAVQFDIAVP